MYIKLEFNGQIRIYGETLGTLQALKDYVKSQFQEVSNNFSLMFQDASQKLIPLKCDQDLRILEESQKDCKSIKIHIKIQEQEIQKQSQEIKKPAQENQKMQTHMKQIDEQIASFHKKQKQDMKGREKERLKEMIHSIIPQLAQMVRKVLINQEEFSQETPDGQTVVHDRVCCDGCNQYPIKGIRYKCSVCDDFDFCEICEKNKEHPHPFLKIRTPDLTPSLLITSQLSFPLRQQNNHQRHRFHNHQHQNHHYEQFTQSLMETNNRKQSPPKETHKENQLNDQNASSNSETVEEKAQKLSEIFNVKYEKCLCLATEFKDFFIDELIALIQNDQGLLSKLDQVVFNENQ